MLSKKFKLGMGQMLVVDGDFKGNLARAVDMIDRAAVSGCGIIVLPECLDLGWSSITAPELAEIIPGKFSEALCKAAQHGHIYVVAGLTERSGDRLYNAAVLISPEGEILLKHRKINILTDVEGIYSVGNSLGVAETSLGKIGINICADNFPDSLALGHSLARMGAQLILSPSAWAVDSDHDNNRDPYGSLWKGSYSSLSALYDLTVVGVSNVGQVTTGPWRGRKCIGCSLAVGPGGNIIAEGAYGDLAEELIIADIVLKDNGVCGTSIAQMLLDKGYVGP